MIHSASPLLLNHAITKIIFTWAFVFFTRYLNIWVLYVRTCLEIIITTDQVDQWEAVKMVNGDFGTTYSCLPIKRSLRFYASREYELMVKRKFMIDLFQHEFHKGGHIISRASIGTWYACPECLLTFRKIYIFYELVNSTSFSHVITIFPAVNNWKFLCILWLRICFLLVIFFLNFYCLFLNIFFAVFYLLRKILL